MKQFNISIVTQVNRERREIIYPFMHGYGCVIFFFYKYIPMFVFCVYIKLAFH